MKTEKFVPLRILNKKQKKEIEDKLEDQFGIKNIPGEVIMRGRERLFLFSGDFTAKEIKKLEEVAIVERIGVYFAKRVYDNGGEKIRLSIEGSQILKNQINKNIFELSDDLAEEWMKGHELLVKTGKKDFLIMRHKGEFLGTGKASEEKISNFIPKSRRLREKNV
jgi:NOL1/NOP2/fmu family ribosome biogenesis protein|tara:strand:- start:342 stop:836 length:495 start_codon:yes stop_codon:yes gene_type:complete